MEYKAVKKGLILFGVIFIGLSIIELVNTVLLWYTKFNLDGKKVLFSELIFTIPLYGTFLFFFLICTIFFNLIIGMVLIINARRKSLEHKVLAKNIFVLGILVLILAFVEMEFITILSRIEIVESGKNKTLQSIFYDANIVPFSVTVIWVFYTAVVCIYFISGSILAGSGLRWILDFKEQEGIEQ